MPEVASPDGHEAWGHVSKDAGILNFPMNWKLFNDIGALYSQRFDYCWSCCCCC